jgi:hypothetical protein
MHPAFDALLNVICDRELSFGQRRFCAVREIELTKQTINILQNAGDSEGLRFGEEYLKGLRELVEIEGLGPV